MWDLINILSWFLFFSGVVLLAIGFIFGTADGPVSITLAPIGFLMLVAGLAISLLLDKIPAWLAARRKPKD